MDKTYEPLEMEIISFENDDIITGSNECSWETEEG